MIMYATVLRVDARSLLVRDESNGQEVLVNFRNASNFRVGDRVLIVFSGAMTGSIPPQITAITIQRLPGPAPVPTPPEVVNELRATVLQTGSDSLLVRDHSTGQQVRVMYAHAHHFCALQQVVILYDTITFDNPPRITATDISPIC